MPPRKKPKTIQDGLIVPLQQGHARASGMIDGIDRAFKKNPVLKRTGLRLKKK